MRCGLTSRGSRRFGCALMEMSQVSDRRWDPLPRVENVNVAGTGPAVARDRLDGHVCRQEGGLADSDLACAQGAVMVTGRHNAGARSIFWFHVRSGKPSEGPYGRIWPSCSLCDKSPGEEYVLAGAYKYPKEFRRNAVEPVRSSHRPISHIAAELGVNHETLRSWVRAAEKSEAPGAAAEAASVRKRPASPRDSSVPWGWTLTRFRQPSDQRSVAGQRDEAGVTSRKPLEMRFSGITCTGQAATHIA